MTHSMRRQRGRAMCRPPNVLSSMQQADAAARAWAVWSRVEARHWDHSPSTGWRAMRAQGWEEMSASWQAGRCAPSDTCMSYPNSKGGQMHRCHLRYGDSHGVGQPRRRGRAVEQQRLIHQKHDEQRASQVAEVGPAGIWDRVLGTAMEEQHLVHQEHNEQRASHVGKVGPAGLHMVS